MHRHMSLPIEITIEELHALRTNQTPHRLIDCREEDEWHLCRIDGAKLMPLSRFAEVTSLLPDLGEHLIVYCHHGMRSLHATQFLRQQGFANTQSLHGGIDLWSEMIDPSVARY